MRSLTSIPVVLALGLHVAFAQSPSSNAIVSESVVQAAPVRALALQLGAKEFRDREAAERKLSAMRFPELEPLKEFRNHDDPEISERVNSILRKVRAATASGKLTTGQLTVISYGSPTNVHAHVKMPDGTTVVKRTGDEIDGFILKQYDTTNRLFVVYDTGCGEIRSVPLK